MALFRGSGTKEVQFTSRLFGQSLTNNCSRARSRLQKVKVNSCPAHWSRVRPRPAEAWHRRGGAGRGGAVGYRTRRELAGQQSARHWTRGTSQDPEPSNRGMAAAPGARLLRAACASVAFRGLDRGWLLACGVRAGTAVPWWTPSPGVHAEAGRGRPLSLSARAWSR